MRDETFTVERIDTVAAFAQIGNEWNQLLDSSTSDCLFLTWEWLFTWWKHLAEDRRLRIITVRRGRELVAIAPLSLRSRRLRYLALFPALEFLGVGNVGSDYLDLIVHPDHERSAIKALAGHLDGRRHMVELPQVERISPHAIDLGLQLKRHGWEPARITTGFCPFIELEGHSWESYLASLGPAHRYNFRRKLRKLHEQFTVRFEKIQSEERRRETFPLLVTLHHKRWYGRGGSDALHTPALVAFHEELSRIALERGWLRLYILWLDGEPAAALYGFSYKDVFYFYQSGFDPDYQKHSVGLLTMGLVIKDAIEEGAKQYDLLHGEERYKFLWARDERELVRLEFYPPRVRGTLYRRIVELRWGMKRMVWQYLPRAVGDRIAPGRRLNAYSKSWRDRDAAAIEYEGNGRLGSTGSELKE